MKTNKSQKFILSIFAVMILVCIIKILIPNKTYEFDTQGDIQTDTESYKHIVCDGIKLPMGVYRFNLEYSPQDTDLPCFFNIEDGSVYSGGFLCNGDFFWTGRSQTECYLWLYETADSLTAYIDVPSNTPLFHYGKLTISETNLLWSMLIVNLLFLCAVIMAVISFLAKLKAGKISAETKLVIIALGAISLLGSLHFLLGFIPLGADTGYHLERIESVAYSIRDGVFPIRLEPYYPFGYGYANGIFYCDLSLYIPAILRLLGFTVQSSFNIFGITCIFAGVIVTYICFKKIFKNAYIAVLGTALYNLASYHAFDAVVRGGVGFLVAGIFLPVLLYGYYRLFSEDSSKSEYKTVWIPITIGYSGIICSHILSFEFAAFWTFVILVTFIFKVFKRKTFLELLKALGAFIALNCWFIVPFLDYYTNEDISIKNASARLIQSNGLVMGNFFSMPLDITELTDDTLRISYLIFNPVVAILLVVFLILWIAGVWKKLKADSFMNLAKVCCIFALSSMVMSLRIFPWDYLHDLNPLFAKLISVIQHPNRFIGFADLFASITVCALIYGLYQFKSSIIKYGTVIVTVLSVLLYSVLSLENFCMKYNHVNLYDLTMQIGYLSGAEYTIYGTDTEIIRPWIAPQTSDMIEIFDYEKRDLGASFEAANYSDTEGYVDLPLLHYKGYKAYDENKTLLQCVKNDDFYVRTILPAGFDGKVTVRFVSPWYWRVSEVISYLAVFFFLLLLFSKKRSNKSKDFS